MRAKHLYKLILVLTFVLMLLSGCGKEEKSQESNEQLDNKLADVALINDQDRLNKEVNDLIKEMSLEEKVGQLLMPDFRKWNGTNVTVINDEIRNLISDYHLGGVILFRENVVDRSQTRALIDAMQAEADIPLLVGVDQEGGLVTRLSFAPRMPGNMAIGATGNPELAKKVGLAIGSELKELGFNINFGPVLDVNNNPDNPVIGVRSFGDNAEIVSEMGIAYKNGLNAAGIAAVGKHFPGHGDVAMDSHYALPTDEKTYEQLKQRELVPFKALTEEGIQGMMTAHITFPLIEKETVKSKKDGLPIYIPATLSSTIQTDILRKDLKFEGVLFTDAMDMQAISDHFGPVDAAIRAIQAGNDIVLMPVEIKSVYEGIIEAVKSKQISEKRIDESVKRILLMKLEFAYDKDQAFEKVDVQEAINIEQAVADASITLVENNGVVPLEEDDNSSIYVVATNKTDLQRLEAVVKEYNWKTKSVLISASTNALGNLSSTQKDSLQSADHIVIATNILNAKDKEWQLKTTQTILDLNIPTVVISARNPYGIEKLNGVEAFIAQYDNGIASFKATGNVLFGKQEATGKLPIQLR